jgi:hypothetical protein
MPKETYHMPKETCERKRTFAAAARAVVVWRAFEQRNVKVAHIYIKWVRYGHLLR